MVSTLPLFVFALQERDSLRRSCLPRREPSGLHLRNEPIATHKTNTSGSNCFFTVTDYSRLRKGEGNYLFAKKAHLLVSFPAGRSSGNHRS